MEQKNGRRPKRERVLEEEQPKPRFTQVSFMAPLQHQNLKSTLDFEWPEYKSDKERIKANTKKFANMSIPEVFGVKVKVENPERFDTLRELKAGDTIDVVVTSISDNAVTFETVATKQIIQSSVNLKKYAKLKLITPFNATAVVTKANREIAYIDIIKPVYEEWLQEVLKDPDLQRTITNPKTITVKNLKLTRGGFTGQASIPVVSEFVGQDYLVDAFIPGSQIVLNIEDKFERWEGQTVEAFVTNYMLKPGTKNEMSLVCSRKDVLKYYGDMNIIKLFGWYCDGGDDWKGVENHVFNGVVTGIINSSKKCGVFVEIPELNITGMVDVPADKLVSYKPQFNVDVKISGFEENTYYDSVTGQIRHDIPYEIEDNVLRSCNIKPLLKFA